MRVKPLLRHFGQPTCITEHARLASRRLPRETLWAECKGQVPAQGYNLTVLNAVKGFEFKTKTSRYTINKVLYSVPCAYAREVFFSERPPSCAYAREVLFSERPPSCTYACEAAFRSVPPQLRMRREALLSFPICPLDIGVRACYSNAFTAGESVTVTSLTEPKKEPP